MILAEFKFQVAIWKERIKINENKILKLCIKQVVSERCKIEVKEELTKLGIHFSILDLSEVAIMENISTEQSEQLQERLLSVGLELMDNDKAILIERIKNVVIETSHHSEEKVKVSIFNYLSEKLGEDYTSLVNLFSDVQGITIYKFLIAHKV